MENFIRSQSQGLGYWDDMSKLYETLSPLGWANIHLQPSPMRGNIYTVMHDLMAYIELIKSGGEQSQIEKLKSTIINKLKTIQQEDQKELFNVWMNEVKEDIYPGDLTLQKVLGKKNIAEYIDHLLTKTKFSEEKKVAKFFEEQDKLEKDNDPLLEAASIFVNKYKETTKIFQNTNSSRQALEAKIAMQAFKVYGDKLPPDATFTLRISDGKIKGYDYNGTTAPVMKTYYGMYDRYYSFGKTSHWVLPEKWMNPSSDLLKSPFNTISTNDIIGGNSGSPLINKNKEVVGLIFDGNIESLP